MQAVIFIFSTEPIEYDISRQASRPIGQQYPIGRILPISKILHKFMLLRILMNVPDHIPKLTVTRDRHTPERVLE
jgi:hypothetical protein